MTLRFKKSFVLLCFGLACLASVSLAQSKKIYCNNKNRPQPDQCFGEGATYEPTCAYYKEDCPLGVCGKYVSNGCDACSDPKVLYYMQQECKPEEVVSACSEDICNLDFDPQQDSVFEPVCGYRKGCTRGDCTQTFDNVCKACRNSNYPWYQSGVCKDDRKSCDKKSQLTFSKQAVCAFFDTADGGVNQHTTVANARSACADPAVNFYMKRECGPNRDDNTYCLPNNRPDFCTREYNPVCGFYMAEDGALKHKIMSNPCSACADSSVVYHQPGPCVFKCNRNPFIIFECDGTYIDPICGTYQENGQTKQVSLKNACVGCYNVPIKIDSYTEGLCPGDEGIRCENDAGGFLIGRISPVCGLFKEGCTKSSCRQTFSESVVACSDSSVVLFKAGMCPGDEGISCNPYRTRPTADDGSFLSNTVYQNVCGYTKKGCTSSSCRKNYKDQYEACKKTSVKFFTEGPCA